MGLWRADKGLNNDNNCIYNLYNYSSAAKNVARLPETPCRRQNDVYTNFLLHNTHTRALLLLHIWRRTLLNTPEHLAPTKCEEFCVLETHTKDASKEARLGRITMTALLQHKLWRVDTCKPVQNTSQAPRTQRVDSNIQLVMLGKFNFRGRQHENPRWRKVWWEK